MTPYEETLDFLFRQLPMFQRVGPKAFKKDLDNILYLCDKLGNPERKFKSIHIAGTNGKGSTAHLVAAALQSAGLKTGLYTSPHYVDFRERIKINGIKIPEEKVIEFVQGLDFKNLAIKPSFFEITVAMAFSHFTSEGVDIAVIETGLGGRLDSTNVITPLLSIITNIGLDHTSFLGDSLEKIAIEKAGIIKEGVPVIIGRTQKETKGVFNSIAHELNSPIYFAQDVVKNLHTIKDYPHLEVSFYINEVEFSGKSDLIGPFQVENIRTAIGALNILQSNPRLNLTSLDFKSAFANVKNLTGMVGRWQELGKAPRIIADSAHNYDGVKIMVDHLRKENYQKLHIVWGMVGDKDQSKVLDLLPTKALYYFVCADVPRGMHAAKLQSKASKSGLKGFAYPSVNSAFHAAKNMAEPEDLIYVGGSIFVVAEVLDSSS